MSTVRKRRKYIAVAGNIGSGKSSLVAFLCKHYGLKPFFEPNEENPYLKDFYADMKRWAFQSQLYFLSRKFRIHQELDRARSKGTVVQDRTIFEDAEIFALNLYRSSHISARDYKVYRDLYETILNAIRPPDLLVYLDAPVRVIRQRIRMRGRPEEMGIGIDYLRRLDRLYKKWFEGYDLSSTLVVDTSKIDYMSDFIHRQDMLDRIESHI